MIHLPLLYGLMDLFFLFLVNFVCIFVNRSMIITITLHDYHDYLFAIAIGSRLANIRPFLGLIAK